MEKLYLDCLHACTNSLNSYHLLLASFAARYACRRIWKRVSSKSIVVVHHPLTTHPKVENKDGDSVIRCTFQGAHIVNQLQNGNTEVEWGIHINFGGRLPKFIVNRFIIPNFDRILSHYIVYFKNSLPLVNLTVHDGKLLGEILINHTRWG